MLRARLFGPLAVEHDGRAIAEIAGLRPRAVLAWLPDGQPAAPTRVTTGRDGSQVVINCLMTEDVYTWMLEPHPAGCRITVRVEVSDGDPRRLSERRAGVLASLPRLAAAAQSAGGGAGRSAVPVDG